MTGNHYQGPWRYGCAGAGRQNAGRYLGHEHTAEISSLTGLRGLAALCVLFDHYSLWVAPLPGNYMPVWIHCLFAFADTGMTLFFMLSGFVIAYNYSILNWRTRPCYSCARFLVYRFGRLYPLFFVFMLIVIWGRGDLFTPAILGNPTHPLMQEVFRHLTLTQTWTPSLDPDGKTMKDSYFHVSWSISTEFFLYISFAILMIIGSRFSTRSFPLALPASYALAAICILLTWQYCSGIFAAIPPRALQELAVW